VALLQIAPSLSDAVDRLSGDAKQGALLVQAALGQPLAAIATNCGLDAAAVLHRVAAAPRGFGLDARTGGFADMAACGVIDPVKVTISALRNAASVATLILTTQTLIAKKPEYSDPTAGPALGGGAELLGRA
jgi:chaperonin GroEL